MIERYSRPEMVEIFSEEGKYARWLAVELAVCEVHGERGLIPAAALAVIRAKAAVDPARVAEIEERVRHDVIAFTTALAEKIGPDSRYVHYGLTSSDVLDTALALQIRDAGVLLAAGVERLRRVLVRRAREFQHAPCIGRTHGVHAEPTTFGLKLLVFAEEMRRQGERLARATEEAAVGKISGAVGTFAHLPPAVEEAVWQRLGIGFQPAPTPGVPRDPHPAVNGAVALARASCGNIPGRTPHPPATRAREPRDAARSRVQRDAPARTRRARAHARGRLRARAEARDGHVGPRRRLPRARAHRPGDHARARERGDRARVQPRRGAAPRRRHL